MEKIPSEILIDNILNNETLKIKGKTLLSYTLLLLIVKGGLLPTKIIALGIEISLSNQKYIIAILLLLCIYLLVSFIMNSIHDFVKNKMLFYVAINKKFEMTGEISGEETRGELNVPSYNESIPKFISNVKKIRSLKLVFDIGITLLYSIIVLILVIAELCSK